VTDAFWVDPDGLRDSATGYEDKATEINKAADMIMKLISGPMVLNASGNDSGGRTFAQAHLEAGGQLHQGVLAWRDAAAGAGQSVKQIAQNFTSVESVAHDGAKGLHRDLNDGSSPGRRMDQVHATGGGQDTATTPFSPAILRPAMPGTPSVPPVGGGAADLHVSPTGNGTMMRMEPEGGIVPLAPSQQESSTPRSASIPADDGRPGDFRLSAGVGEGPWVQQIQPSAATPFQPLGGDPLSAGVPGTPLVDGGPWVGGSAAVPATPAVPTVGSSRSAVPGNPTGPS
jgi:hypothetical protein